jgi:hypothetical protein
MITNETPKADGVSGVRNISRKLSSASESMFGTLPKSSVPMISGDHPEMA